MRERQYSNHNGGFPPRSKLNTFSTAVAAVAAMAGIGFTGWQTFGPSGPPPAINVTVAAPALAPPPPVNETVAAKADAPLAVLQPVSFSAALNDGTDKFYAFADLFDGRPDTFLTISAKDRELNILAAFAEARTITGLEYAPPNAAGAPLASTIDVMILPEGRLEATGRAVMSFALQTTPGSQSFTLPASERGKALWIRVAGPDGTEASVGDFKVLSAP